MIQCIQVLYIINARIRIVQNFVDQPSASTSLASSRGVFVLLYKAFMRAKFYGKQGNPAIWFYKQRYTERYVILLFNVRNMFWEKNSFISSFSQAVLLTVIMKPHPRSTREKNIEDLVWGKFPNYVFFSGPKFSLPSLLTNYIF